MEKRREATIIRGLGFLGFRVYGLGFLIGGASQIANTILNSNHTLSCLTDPKPESKILGLKPSRV